MIHRVAVLLELFLHRRTSLMHESSKQVMSKLLIVSDLSPLRKMGHGAGDVQTPQPARMTLGNTGAVRLPSSCWSFLFGFHRFVSVCPWAASGNPINTGSMLPSLFVWFG